MLTSLVFHVFLVAVLALVVGIACRLGRFRPAVCHALWLVVLIKLSLPPVMPWPSSLQEMLPGAPQAFIETEQVQAPAPAAAQTHDAPSSVPPVQAASSTPVWRYVSPLLAVIWLIGCLFTLTLHLFRIRGFRSLLKQAQPAPEWLQQCSNELAKAFAVRPPTVKVVSGLASALVWNPWRSKLLVSCDLLNSIRRDEWHGIVSHELAHLKRRDLWVSWLELAATCVWWWNPLLILVRRRLHLYAELACDAWVLWALPESGSQYAEVLFKIVSSETQRQTPVPAFGMAAGSAAAFKARLSLLLEGGAGCRIPRKAIAAIVALLLVAVPSLTPTANAAKCVPTPAFYGSSGPQETTRDADAVIETRLYIVRDKLKGLDDNFSPPKAADIRGLYLRGLASKMSPSQVTVGGLPVTMEGATLLWNGKDEPESAKVAHMASPIFAVRGNNDVAVSAALPAQALKWLKAEESLQLSFTCRPAEKDNMRLWLNIVPADDRSGSTVWTNVIVEAPPNQWSALVAEICAKGKKRTTLLMFWKRRPCDPSQPVQELPGPAHGEFKVSHSEGEEGQAHDPKLTFRADMKLIEAPAADIESIVADLPPATGATTSPAGLRIFKIAGSDEFWKRILNNFPDSQLISAPRLTFHADAVCKVLLHEASKELRPFSEGIESFSGSLAGFFNEAHPQAIMIDNTDEQFLSGDSKETQHIVFGVALAIATAKEVHDNTLDVNFLYNYKELIRHYRGHLFWKKELMPDVVETVVNVKLPYHIDEGLCFITKSLDPQKLRLVFLTLEHADTPDR